MIITGYSKFLGYNVGGAEISTISLLQSESSKSSRIRVVCHGRPKFLGHLCDRISLPSDWGFTTLDGLYSFNKFSFMEYAVNRKSISAWFEGLHSDELWAYGVTAPAAINAFGGATKYFVRSESDLGINRNYYSGGKKFLRAGYSGLQYLAKKMHDADLGYAIERSYVVANSKYMATRTESLFGVAPEVVYPPVDVSEIRRRLRSVKQNKEWIVFVGDNDAKGLRHVLDIAKGLPRCKFKIFSRFIKAARHEGNINWMPWQTEPWRIFVDARLIIVPSQWEEAYGRLAREAFLLGIPVLVSNVGGLPEAVDSVESSIVDDFRNPSAWIEEINKVMS